MKRPLIGAKDFEAFIGQGEQAQRRSWRLTKGEFFFCVRGKKKRRRMKCEERLKLLCVDRCSWKRCVQELNMEGSCV